MSFNKLILKGVLVVMFCTIFSPGWSQSDFRNSIQTSIGFIPTVSGAYERVIFKPVPGKALTIAKLGYSGGGILGYVNSFYGQLGVVTNGSKHRLEFTMGGGVKEEEGQIEGIFSGNIGYRLHKTKSRWMFRTGIGFPEFLYVGFGFRF